jgi:hypothetical protein
MKLAAIFLAVPLTLGWGFAHAQSKDTTTDDTTTEESTTVIQPAPVPPVTASTSQHIVMPNGQTIDRTATATRNPDGSVTMNKTDSTTR